MSTSPNARSARPIRRSGPTSVIIHLRRHSPPVTSTQNLSHLGVLTAERRWRVRLLFAFAGNEGHLQPMRYLVLSPFPPSKGDHVDPLGPTTHFFQFDQEPRLSAASSLLDQLAGGPTTSGVFSAFYTNGGGCGLARCGLRDIAISCQGRSHRHAPAPV